MSSVNATVVTLELSKLCKSLMILKYEGKNNRFIVSIENNIKLVSFTSCQTFIAYNRSQFLKIFASNYMVLSN